MSQLLADEAKLAATIESTPLVIEELIRVTGRPVRNDTFSNLKHRKEIDQILNAILTIYKKKECKQDFDKVVNEFICRILEDRKTELSIHGVG